MIVAGVVALTTAAATAGAAAAAGSYGIYKYLKKKRNRQARDRSASDKELDLGQELEVYKVTETKIPPPVAPKPMRGERRAAVVTVQPGQDNGPDVVGNHEGSCSGGATACRLSNQALITRLCPNAVKVLPDPPEHRVVLSSSRSSRKDSQTNCRATASSSARESDQSSFSKDAIRMKTLQRNLEESI